MALIKQIQINSGVSPEYWAILTVALNFNIDEAIVTMGGFLDKEARVEGREPIVTKAYSITISQFFTAMGLDQYSDLRYALYQFIKGTIPDYSESQDDL